MGTHPDAEGSVAAMAEEAQPGERPEDGAAGGPMASRIVQGTGARRESARPSKRRCKLRKVKTHVRGTFLSFSHLPKTLGNPGMFASPSSRQGSFQGNNAESKAPESRVPGPLSMGWYHFPNFVFLP